ncbi:hypothetical protein GOBAR_DD19243 [Gossypium barbadense]|nr:hypothetical protein GOBAR_DD19243 [Gossypium barbadense]
MVLVCSLNEVEETDHGGGSSCCYADGQNVISQRIRAPHKNVGDIVIGGTSTEKVITSEDNDNAVNDWNGSYSKVSVSIVMLFTLAMAAATGLGAIPFFFIEREMDGRKEGKNQSRRKDGGEEREGCEGDEKR